MKIILHQWLTMVVCTLNTKKIIIEECERISIDYKDFIAPAWQIQRMNSEFKKFKKLLYLVIVLKNQ